MSITVSPLNLTLDIQNPRFVVIDDSSEASIRKYMAMYEDVCQLAEGINNNKGLLLGERIVVIQEDNQTVVMEGNRRTVALQFLIDRSLIPNGFEHKVPTATQETLNSINTVEVDVAPNRDYAVALMSKRHIEGVKRWKPLAKKQFFATMFINGTSISQLSSNTGIEPSSIRNHIRDYKLLLSVSRKYKHDHPEFDEDLITYKIDPFLRIFKSKENVGSGLMKSPIDILKITYDAQENAQSDLPGDMFERILQKVFKATIVDEVITTRNSLFEVSGVKDLLDTLEDDSNGGQPGGEQPGGGQPGGGQPGGGQPGGGQPGGGQPGGGQPGGGQPGGGQPGGGQPGGGQPGGGPTPGGASPGTFFEHVSWNGKLIPTNMDHIGLIVALDELHRMSRNTTRQGTSTLKIYGAYPVGAGMLLRTAYEQALKLQLRETGEWGNLVSQTQWPMLSHIETYVSSHITTVLPLPAMRSAFNQIINANSRDFLNANVHSPGLIRTTASTLEGLSSGGMLSLIQLIINNL